MIITTDASIHVDSKLIKFSYYTTEPICFLIVLHFYYLKEELLLLIYYIFQYTDAMPFGEPCFISIFERPREENGVHPVLLR